MGTPEIEIRPLKWSGDSRAGKMPHGCATWKESRIGTALWRQLQDRIPSLIRSTQGKRVRFVQGYTFDPGMDIIQLMCAACMQRWSEGNQVFPYNPAEMPTIGNFPPPVYLRRYRLGLHCKKGLRHIALHIGSCGRCTRVYAVLVIGLIELTWTDWPPEPCRAGGLRAREA